MRARWQTTWDKLGISAPNALFDQLMVAYAEPQRHYHTAQHLQEVFALVDVLNSVPEATGELELALWFHDAVYDPRRADKRGV